MRYDDESFTGLDRAKRGRRAGRPRRRWTGTASQRASAASGAPQAVFKISSYSHSAGAVSGRFEYISREGEVELEGRDGERLDLEAREARAAAWGEEAEARHTQRVSMSAVLSFPGDVDEEQAREVARAFLREAFADNHDYVWGVHSDTKNVHVHFVVQAAGLDGKQLKIGRADIQDLRMMFAERAREQGIELDASPRWARGLEKAQRRGPEIEGMLRRWSQPEHELAGAVFLGESRRSQLEALVEVRRARDPAAGVTPLEYARAAEHLVERAGAQDESAAQVQTMKAAIQLARFGLHQSREPDCAPGEAAAVVQVVGQVDRAIRAHSRELGAEPEAQREERQARRPLAAELELTRPEPERKWAREEEKGRPGPWDQCQALEYARAGWMAVGGIEVAATDQDKVAVVKGAVEMARFGWELAKKDQGSEEERAQAREIIEGAELALRYGITKIEDPQAKKEAIQARQRLYHAGVKEYREAQREEGRRRREQEPGQELEATRPAAQVEATPEAQRPAAQVEREPEPERAQAQEREGALERKQERERRREQMRARVEGAVERKQERERRREQMRAGVEGALERGLEQERKQARERNSHQAETAAGEARTSDQEAPGPTEAAGGAFQVVSSREEAQRIARRLPKTQVAHIERIEDERGPTDSYAVTTLPAPAEVARHQAVIAERIAKLEDPEQKARAQELLNSIEKKVRTHTRDRSLEREEARGLERKRDLERGRDRGEDWELEP